MVAAVPPFVKKEEPIAVFNGTTSNTLPIKEEQTVNMGMNNGMNNGNNHSNNPSSLYSQAQQHQQAMSATSYLGPTTAIVQQGITGVSVGSAPQMSNSNGSSNIPSSTVQSTSTLSHHAMYSQTTYPSYGVPPQQGGHHMVPPHHHHHLPPQHHLNHNLAVSSPSSNPPIHVHPPQQQTSNYYPPMQQQVQQQHASQQQQVPQQQVSQQTVKAQTETQTTTYPSNNNDTQFVYHQYSDYRRNQQSTANNNSTPMQQTDLPISNMQDQMGDYHPIACIPCRKRHKKCDRKLPKCSECGRRAIDCEYYEPKQKGRKKKDDLPNSSEMSPSSSPTQNDCTVPVQQSPQSQQIIQQQPSQPQYSNTFSNYQPPYVNPYPQQQPPNIMTIQSVPQKQDMSSSSPYGYGPRGGSVPNSPDSRYNKQYRTEPYPASNIQRDMMEFNNTSGSYSPVIPQQRDRAGSSASASHYPMYPANGTNMPLVQHPPPQLRYSTPPQMPNNAYLQSQPPNPYASPEQDIVNTSSLSRFIPIEKEQLREHLNSLKRGEVESWETHRVAQWIDTIDPSFSSNNIGELFKKHDVDGVALLGLHNQALQDMGVPKMGIIVKLCRIVEHLRLQQ